MNLPNEHFQNFPVEFKKIDPSDFPNLLVENGTKTIIRPDSNGFINTEVQANVVLNEKDTTIINGAVGQGKSYAIIKTIQRYYNANDRYMIIVASPFVSLVDQYCNDIHVDAEIPENQIFNYANLELDETGEYKNKKVHVLAINTLLGNPGEEGFKNSQIKRKYLNDLIQHCQTNRIKVVFIYDEIHDAIKNFKEEYIFNLWKWKDVIHKNFILSATFNKASKVVIEYLAELTDKKLKIIESVREIFPEKQSKLYLNYNSVNHFTDTTREIEDLIKRLIDRNKDIDVLCYSKALAKLIIKDNAGAGKLLKDRFGELNDCTSSSITRKRFDNQKCNVGTNFKTGVSITKENHAFVIILPPR